jgi:transposase
MADKIIKTSQHSTKFANTGKVDVLFEFLDEYEKIKWWFVDYLWVTKIKWGNNGQVLDVKNNQLDVPSFISTPNIPYTSELSARAIKSASSEALGIIKSRTKKRKSQLHVLAEHMRAGKVKDVKRLQSKIDSNPLTKPTATSTNATAALDSNCCHFAPSESTEFDGWLELKSLGKKYGKIIIPVNFTKHSNKLAKKGYQMMAVWQISKTVVASTWELEKPTSTGTKVIGADQGVTTCLSLSDSQTTGVCSHGHDLKSIIDKLARKKKGSKAFAKAQAHRTNYINWSISQLNLQDVKELRLEKLFQMRKGQNVGGKLSHWTYTQINAQIKSRCEELGVLVTEQSAVYRSQRCSDCGWTQKSNRKRKEFICKSCGHHIDADINGALNHEVDLYPLPFGFRQLNMNRKGFFWYETHLFDSTGQEITVPDVQKDNSV